MTPEQSKLFALMMGKCWHEWYEYAPKRAGTSRVVKCKVCGEQQANKTRWSPSPDGKRLSYEVIDFMMERLPEWWDDYLCGMYLAIGYRHFSNGLYTDVLNGWLSLSNLFDYILAHYKEMFYEECDNPDCKQGKVLDATVIIDCPFCNGTGKIVKPGFVEVVKFIKSLKRPDK